MGMQSGLMTIHKHGEMLIAIEKRLDELEARLNEVEAYLQSQVDGLRIDAKDQEKRLKAIENMHEGFLRSKESSYD